APSMLAFPTRRSSDLCGLMRGSRTAVSQLCGRSGLELGRQLVEVAAGVAEAVQRHRHRLLLDEVPQLHPARGRDRRAAVLRPGRSEEHTSELQSRFDL